MYSYQLHRDAPQLVCGTFIAYSGEYARILRRAGVLLVHARYIYRAASIARKLAIYVERPRRRGRRGAAPPRRLRGRIVRRG